LQRFQERDPQRLCSGFRKSSEVPFYNIDALFDRETNSLGFAKERELP
jgi:hypothetical protein